MTDHRFHPLTAVGMGLSGWGALAHEYGPTLVGFAFALVGWWLQRWEHRRHESELRSIAAAGGGGPLIPPPFLPAEAAADAPE
jgi:hypothetical protein